MKFHRKDYLWIGGLFVAVLLFFNLGIQFGMHRRPVQITMIEDGAQMEKTDYAAWDTADRNKNVAFPSLELLGTILGKPSVAFIFNPASGSSGLYKVNDVIAEARIVSIMAGKIMLEKAGVTKELFLVSNKTRDEVQKESVISKDDAGTMFISKFQMMGQLLKANEILSKIKIMPLADSASNKLRGFRIDNVPSGSILEEAGIKNGDVIFSVQGQQLQSMQDALTMFNRVQSQSRVEVVLLRDDKPVTLRYEIRN